MRGARGSGPGGIPRASGWGALEAEWCQGRSKLQSALGGAEHRLALARCGRLPGRRGQDAASRGASGGIKEAKGGQPARLGLWDKGRETEDWHGRGDPGLACACVIGRVCVRVSVCGSTRSCPRPRPGWIRVWVDRLPGGCPNRREREGARSRATRSAGSSVCVSQALWLSTGAAWHPQECGFSRLPRPPPVPQGGGRQEKGGGE